MSNIPSSAIGAAFVPVQQAANELVRARQVQFQKNTHHAEDVEELDDTAVNSVHDQRQGKEKREKPRKKRDEGEQVDIEALKEAGAERVQGEGATKSAAHLDISA